MNTTETGGTLARPDRKLRPDNWNRSLFDALLDTTHRLPSDPALEDQDRRPIARRRLVLASFVLGRRLAAMTGEGERVGVMLPNVNAVAVAIFALLAYGRVPAMLNFTAGLLNLEAAAEIAQLRLIITSRKFAETARLEETLEGLGKRLKVVYLEDVRASLSLADKVVGALMARMPRRAHRRYRAKPDDVAVVLFTSGTERQPKAVALTHANILANIEQVVVSIAFVPPDLMFNALPVFHSFGLTAGLFLPLIAGFRAFLYPSPLHYNEIPRLVRETKATIIVTIDTFANQWARASEGDEFRSVRLMVLGAERVKEATRAIWQERFGVELLEGYGVTEAAPVVAVNLPGENRIGTVGPILPGIETRLEPVPGIEVGQRLLVRGPNVMAGYFSPERPGHINPLPGGWHDTGDLVTISEDGYLTIHGRAKRFAKIAGEMVSLAAVEGYVAIARPDHSHAVVALPDPRRGEVLVLVTTATDLDRQTLLPVARRLGFSDLTVPDRILTVETLPALGTGKADYVAVQKLAAERLAERAAAAARGHGAGSPPDIGPPPAA